MRVLIVEDETLVAMLAEDVVESCGYAVVGVAATCPDAIALADKHNPDIALVDLNLLDGFTGPEIGITLAERFGVRVLFVSGNVDKAPTGRAAIFGAIQKPYSQRELKSRLNELAAFQAEGLSADPANVSTNNSSRNISRADEMRISLSSDRDSLLPDCVLDS